MYITDKNLIESANIVSKKFGCDKDILELTGDNDRKKSVYISEESPGKKSVRWSPDGGQQVYRKNVKTGLGHKLPIKNVDIGKKSGRKGVPASGRVEMQKRDKSQSKTGKGPKGAKGARARGQGVSEFDLAGADCWDQGKVGSTYENGKGVLNAAQDLLNNINDML
jgi:hypothetical protein